MTASVACSGRSPGSVRMAVLVLRRRRELRTTENIIKNITNVKCVFTKESGLTGSEGRKSTVLIQPGQSGATELLDAGCGHHAIVGLKERLNDDAELKWTRSRIRTV